MQNEGPCVADMDDDDGIKFKVGCQSDIWDNYFAWNWAITDLIVWPE